MYLGLGNCALNIANKQTKSAPDYTIIMADYNNNYIIHADFRKKAKIF